MDGAECLLNQQLADVALDPFSTFEELFPELVTTNSSGKLTGNVVDFCKHCRLTIVRSRD